MGRLCLECPASRFFRDEEDIFACGGRRGVKGEETREGVREMVMEWEDMSEGVRMLSSSSSSPSSESARFVGRELRDA